MEAVAEKKKKSKYGKFDEWEIENLADKMIDIENCKKDKEKMKYVLKCLKEKEAGNKKAISSIADIRKAADDMDYDDE